MFDSEWHWSVWHQHLLCWSHEWLLFKQVPELSRLALQFITLLAFFRQSWRKNLHLHCTCHRRSQRTWLILAHMPNLNRSQGQKFSLSLLSSSQDNFSSRSAMTVAHQGHATLSTPCPIYQFQNPWVLPIAIESCLQKRLLKRKLKTVEVYSNPQCLYLCSPCHSRAEKMSLEQFSFCQQARGLKRGSNLYLMICFYKCLTCYFI